MRQNIKHIALLSLLLAPLELFYSAQVYSCQPPRGEPPRVKTRDEKVAEAAVVVSGRVVNRIDDAKSNRFFAKFVVEKYTKGEGPKLVMVQGAISIPCQPDIGEPLLPGQWWTLILNKSGNGAAYYVVEMETYCAAAGAVESNAPRGYCRHTLTQKTTVGRYTFAANSTVVVRPDRDMKNLWSATVSAGSSFDRIALPEGSVVSPQDNKLALSKELTIGPIKLKGRVRLGNFADYERLFLHTWSLSTRYFAETDRESDSPENLLLYGAQALNVYFTMPGPIVSEASFSKPVFLNGYYLSGFARFSRDGSLVSFQSARDQVVNGLKIRKCDIVQLNPLQYPFLNPCKAH